MDVEPNGNLLLAEWNPDDPIKKLSLLLRIRGCVSGCEVSACPVLNLSLTVLRFLSLLPYLKTQESSRLPSEKGQQAHGGFSLHNRGKDPESP